MRKFTLNKILSLSWLILLSLNFINIIAATEISAQNKTYTIATDTTFAPFEFQDASGKYVGIDMDLIHQIAENANIDIQIQALGFNAAVQALESGQVDAVIAGMSITEERKQVFDFSTSYYSSGVGMSVATGSDIQSLDDLTGKTVAVKTGTDGANFAESIQAQYQLKLSTFDDSANMYQDVISGNSVAAFEDAPVMAYSIKTHQLPLTLVNIDSPKSDYGLAVLKGHNQELLTIFNTGLQTFKENGTYETILNTYIGENVSTSTEDTSFGGLIKTNGLALLGGLWQTVWITFVSIVIASIIGIIIGLMRTSHRSLLNIISGIYVDLFRGIPLIVLAFFIYFGIPQTTGVAINATIAGITTLSLNASAYIAEIVRGGINGVDFGQNEAAMSLGLTYRPMMTKIILPQAIKLMIPSLINQFVITLKDTSILSIIGLVELTQTGKIIIARNLQSSKMWLIVGVLYLIIITLLTKISARLEKEVK